MYTKDELEKLSIPELMEIANEVGVKVSQNDELDGVDDAFQFVVLRHLHAHFIGYLHQFGDRKLF